MAKETITFEDMAKNCPDYIKPIDSCKTHYFSMSTLPAQCNRRGNPINIICRAVNCPHWYWKNNA